MRYIDSGRRDADEALGTWLNQVLVGDVTELRWQTGFYGATALNWFHPVLERLAGAGAVVRILVGSNEQNTIAQDVAGLVESMGLPREQAKLGVVSFDNAFFHPKTVHVRREDGSQAAYVGSANLTSKGIAALHVEAGLILDTNDADNAELLNDFASAIDRWFEELREGLHLVRVPGDVDELLRIRVLARRRRATPRTRQEGEDHGDGYHLPRLSPLLPIGPTRSMPVTLEETQAETEEEHSGAADLPVESHEGYPDYVVFLPGVTGPTRGIEAISGQSLPSGAVGLVFTLSRDSARHFDGGVGTANISVPVSTARTIRFGVMGGNGRYPQRPRAEFPIRMRYLKGNGQHVVLADAPSTGIMLYGYLEGEPGHRDIRMVMPASVRELADELDRQGLARPSHEHPALLEWPTEEAPEFRVTFLEPDSPAFLSARGMIELSASNRTAASEGACLLFDGVSPPWNVD